MGNVYFINGSPRMNGNTARLLESAMEGAREAGAEVERIDLYKYNYQGCRSCYACKLKDSRFTEVCAVKDELTPVLEKLRGADAVVIGTPLYYMDMTGMTKSFMERFYYPPYQYTAERTVYKGSLKIGYIYSMNMTEEMAEKTGTNSPRRPELQFARLIFREKPLSLFVYDTKQFDDYSRYNVTNADPAHKQRRMEEQFPEDLRKARELGYAIAKK